MRLFVTGASGYLGGAVARALLPHHRLRLLVRHPNRLDPFWHRPEIEMVEGDLMERSSWEEALNGCEGVVHLAALVTQWASPKQFFALNRDTFRHLLELCWKKRIGSFLYTSSFIALGPTEPNAGQDLWRANAYADSKREALQLARGYQKKGFPLTVLIPTVLYGPGARTEGNHMSPLLERLVQDRPLLLPDRGRWIWNFAFIDDVADGHRLALEQGKQGEEYILGGASVSLEHFFATAARLLKQDGRIRSLPFLALRGYAMLEEFRASVIRRPPHLTRGALAVYRHNWEFQDRKAREELGYTPVPLEEGLKQTLDWLKETR